MTGSALLAAFLAAAPAWTQATPPESLDLAQCFELARRQAETLQLQSEAIVQLEQQYRQVLGSVYPNIGFAYTDKFQDTSGISSSSGTSSVFFSSPQQQANFTLIQPLFTGFREFATMRSYKHRGEEGRLLLKHATTLLFQDVSRAFYLVLQLEKDLANAQTTLSLTRDRVKELREREDLGKSRLSEVVTVESEAATLTAQVEGLKGQIDVARELLSFLIGRDASGVSLLDKLPDVPEVQAEAKVLGLADGRSDVRAAREELESQRQLLKVAKGAWWPVVGLTGNYYLQRVSFLEPIKWDLTLGINLPLFSGGSTVAQVREGESRLRSAEDGLSLAARQARSQIRTAYLQLRATAAQALSLDEAFKKAEESYRLQAKEYRQGLVNNLDVIQAMNIMQDAKRALDHASVDGKLGWLQLQVAVEALP